MKIKEKKNKSAISLIVLVITVLVLSILASVVIISLQGSDIISRAGEVKKEYEISSLQEVANMAYVESQFKTYSSDKEREEDIMSMISESVANDEVLSNYYIVVTDTGAKVYDKDGWDIAYIANADGWQNEPIEKGGKAEGDFVAKFYKQSEILELSGSEVLNELLEDIPDLEFPNSNAYVLIIEGTGEMPALMDDDGAYAWLNQFEEYLGVDEGEEQIGTLPVIPYISEVVICDGITSIAELSFAYAVSLRNIAVPDSVIAVGEDVFELCESLNSITLPGITSVSQGELEGLKGLKNITLPSTTDIGAGAFTGFTNLVSISLPNAVNIGENAFVADSSFDVASNLTSVNLPKATNIGVSAFNGCVNLTSVNIPSVTSIGEMAFAWCCALTSISLPKSLTSVGEEAFFVWGKDDYGRSGLTDVYYEGSEEEWNNITIGNGNNRLTRATIHYNSSM